MVELPKVNLAETLGGAVAIGGLSALLTHEIIKHHHKKGRKRKARHKNRKKKIYRGKRKLKFGSKAYRKKYLKHGKRKKQRQPHTAGKRRDTSGRRIRFTKNNQPYVILSNGRARFISKKNLSRSRKRSGGRY